ncbi:MAG: nucleotidyltransferase domain-containing protein [Firmicutes bacterium]|nr:nucleotidyltransferase domain-containing protein [Bacillota bacterium]
MAVLTTLDENVVNAIQLANNYPSIIRMGVFGSCARGEQTSESDIDIIYDYDDTQIDDMMECLEAIDNRLQKKIDFVAYYLLFEDGMSRSEANFKENVLRDVKWIYIKPQT